MSLTPCDGAVNESVAAMLERVDADEAALMSEDLCPSPYFHLQPQAKLETHSSAPQLGAIENSGVRVLQPITPAQTDKAHRRPFPASVLATEVGTAFAIQRGGIIIGCPMCDERCLCSLIWRGV